MAVELDQILKMLHERSQRGRNLVFRHVADLFLSGKLPESADDRAALAEILRILLPKVDLSVRRELSGHLYSMAHPPETLLEILIDDVDEVSGPLLDYAAIPAQMMHRLIDTAPIEVISRLKRRRDLSDDVRARIDQRFATTPIQKTSAQSASRQSPPKRINQPTGAPPQQEPQSTTPFLPTPRDQRKKGTPAAQRNPYYADVAALDSAMTQSIRGRFKLRDFVRACSDWQWETDRHGRITYLSESAARAFGRPVTTLMEKPLDAILAAPDEEKTTADFNRFLQRRSPFDDWEVATTGIDGTCAWKLAAVPVFDIDSGRFQGYRGIAEAITPNPTMDRPANSNRLSGQSGQVPVDPALDRAIADVIQGVSHELRTPLNAILGFSEMIQLETWGKINDDYRRCVESIITAARQLNELISDILENAKLRAHGDEIYPRSFSLSSIIQESVEAVADQARRQNMTIDMPPEGLRAIIYSDPRFVQYALVRLLRCALEDGAPGTSIRPALTTSNDGSVDIKIPFRRKDGATGSNLSALSHFRFKLAEELAASVGATVSIQRTDDSQMLTLRLPPHERAPADIKPD
ncbi:MAG: PAS domain-containing sensor histidine kinase [Alphaproteobacteria bacterium]|nr:MAG: PAS domain-containing sensor histidine kinase [Alphaproteobacteria bacterium]